jgi:hypothetical protein
MNDLRVMSLRLGLGAFPVPQVDLYEDPLLRESQLEFELIIAFGPLLRGRREVH